MSSIIKDKCKEYSKYIIQYTPDWHGINWKDYNSEEYNTFNEARIVVTSILNNQLKAIKNEAAYSFRILEQKVKVESSIVTEYLV